MTAVPWLEEPVAAWPDALPDHVSATSLGMLERCAEQYRRRYVLGEREPPSAALVWGSCDGKAHGVNWVQKIDSHEDLPVGDVQTAFAALLDAEVEERGGASEIDWRDDTPGAVKDKGVALVGAYHAQVSPRVQPTEVEGKIEVLIPGVPVPYIGYVDVDTAAYAIERKTSSAKSQEIPPQYRLQTLGYALARQKPVELHISTRTIKPAVYTPVEHEGLLLPFDGGLTDRVGRLIASRVRHLLALFNEFGPDSEWPDAVGTQAWHMPVCQMCGWGPTGSKVCKWWN